MAVRRGGLTGDFRFPSAWEIGGANKRKQERRKQFEDKVSNVLLRICGTYRKQCQKTMECVEEKGKQEERTQVVLVHRTNLF